MQISVIWILWYFLGGSSDDSSFQGRTSSVSSRAELVTTRHPLSVSRQSFWLVAATAAMFRTTDGTRRPSVRVHWQCSNIGDSPQGKCKWLEIWCHVMLAWHLSRLAFFSHHATFPSKACRFVLLVAFDHLDVIASIIPPHPMSDQQLLWNPGEPFCQRFCHTPHHPMSDEQRLWSPSERFCHPPARPPTPSHVR